MKRVLNGALCLLAAVAAAAAIYAGYAFAAYYRLEDRLDLPVENDSAAAVQLETAYTVLSYNVGFGAYSADYSFFMDGGVYSRAFSPEAVRKDLAGAAAVLEREAPDFALLEEVDVAATRSYQIDQRPLLRSALPDHGAVFAQNYDSPYLLWPLNQPHGKSLAGMLTLSRYHMDSSLRRSLPVESGLSKFMDLDRCYSVTRLPTAEGGTLCLYTVHLSAYTSDGSIATQQLRQLLSDMAGEYAAGNYAVCGGDFNKDLLGNSAERFGVSGEGETWAQPFPTELLPEGISLVAPYDAAVPVPSCRNADSAYDPASSFVLTVDGFLVSGNVTVQSAAVVDTGFAWSDHNPVKLVFSLNAP